MEVRGRGAESEVEFVQILTQVFSSMNKETRDILEAKRSPEWIQLGAVMGEGRERTMHLKPPFCLGENSE